MKPSKGEKYRHGLSSSSLEVEGGGGQVVLERRGLYVWEVDGEVDDVLGGTTRQIIAQRSRGVLLTFSGADSEERWAQRTSGCWTIWWTVVDGVDVGEEKELQRIVQNLHPRVQPMAVGHVIRPSAAVLGFDGAGVCSVRRCGPSSPL